VLKGPITLGDVAEHTTALAVACNRCERSGRYDLDTLIARHGEVSVFRGCCACCPKPSIPQIACAERLVKRSSREDRFISWTGRLPSCIQL
jgi:hypothetical protein